MGDNMWDKLWDKVWDKPSLLVPHFRLFGDTLFRRFATRAGYAIMGTHPT
jgi:hypothetical protein